MSTVVTRLFDSYDQAARAVADLEAAGIPHNDISIVANNNEGRLGNNSVTSSAADVDRDTGYTGTSRTMGDTSVTPGFGGTTAGMTPAAGLAGSPGYTAGTPATGYTDTTSRYSDTSGDYADRDAPATGAGTGATIGTVLGGGAGLLAGLGMLAIPGVGPVVAAGWLIATAVGAGVGAAGGGLLGSLVGAGVNETDAHVYAEGVRRGGTLVTARVDEGQRANVEAILSRYSGVDANTRGNEYRAGGWERFDEKAPAYTAGASSTLGASPTTLDEPVLGTRPNTLTGV